MNNDKQQKWSECQKWAKQVVDNFGMPLDAGITDTVIVLNLLGISTTMSCEGHIETSASPYVSFHDPIAEELEEKFRVITDRESSEFQRLYDEACRLNILQKERIIPLLDAFYRNRLVPFTQRLILAPVWAEGGMLQCQGVGSELLIQDPEARHAMLTANQAEMRAFTEFMTRQYFQDESQSKPLSRPLAARQT